MKSNTYINSPNDSNAIAVRTVQPSTPAKVNARSTTTTNIGRAVHVSPRKIDANRILPPIYTNSNPIIANPGGNHNGIRGGGPIVRPTLASKAAKRRSLMERGGSNEGNNKGVVRPSKPTSPISEKPPNTRVQRYSGVSQYYLSNTTGAGAGKGIGNTRDNNNNYRQLMGPDDRYNKTTINRSYRDIDGNNHGSNSALTYAKIPIWKIDQSASVSPRDNTNVNRNTIKSDQRGASPSRVDLSGQGGTRGIDGHLVATNKQNINQLARKGNDQASCRTSPLISSSGDGRRKSDSGAFQRNAGVEGGPSIPRSGITPPISQMMKGVGKQNANSPKSAQRHGQNSVKDNSKHLYLPARSEIVPPVNKSSGMNNNHSERRLIGPSSQHNNSNNNNNNNNNKRVNPYGTNSTTPNKSTVTTTGGGGTIGGEHRRLVQTNPDLVQDPKFSSTRPTTTNNNNTTTTTTTVRYPGSKTNHNTNRGSGLTKGRPTIPLSERLAQHGTISRGIGVGNKHNIGSKVDGIKGGHSNIPTTGRLSPQGKKSPNARKTLTFRCRPDEVMRRKSSEQLTDWYMGAYCYESPDTFFRNLLKPNATRVSIKPNDRGTLNQMYGEHSINSRRLREVSSVIGAAMYS